MSGHQLRVCVRRRVLQSGPGRANISATDDVLQGNNASRFQHRDR